MKFANLENTGLVVHGFSSKPIETPEEFAATLKIDPSRIFSAEQVHQDMITVIREDTKEKVIAGSDALITDIPGKALVIRTADCAPIFLLDPKTKSIGLVHSGWKGAVLDIAGKTVRKMQDEYGAIAGDIVAAIGPAICASCYEVGEDVAQSVMTEEKNFDRFLTPAGEGKYLFDLKKLTADQLLRSGVKEESLFISSECTFCQKDLFWSFRRDGERAKRMFGVLMLLPFQP